MISKSKYTRDELVNIVSKTYKGKEDNIRETINFLIDNKYIVEKCEDIELSNDLEMYNRIIPLWSEFESESFSEYDIHNNIVNKKVGIIGCGGIGSGIISNLVSYGVKNFILMDPDVVEPSNITRQPLFSLQDLSKQKTEVLRSFIKNRVKNASVETYNKKFELEDDLKYFEDVDILIFAADSSNFKDILSDNITTPENILEKFSYRKNIPLAYCGGYKGVTGRVLPIVIPGVTHSLHCILHDIIQTNENSNFDFVLDLNHNTEITLSTIPETCKVISSIMSFEIIKYLSGILPLSLVNKIIFVEFKNYSLSQSEISLNENHTCLCGLSP